MKRYTITFLAVISVTLVQAQFSRYSLFIGPTVGTNSYQSNSDNLNYVAGPNQSRAGSTNSYAFSVGPQIGVFVSDHLAVGGLLNYSLSSRNTTTSTLSIINNSTTTAAKTNTSTLSAGPFARYYFFDKLTKNIVYAQVNGTVGTGSGASSGSGVNVTSTYTSDGQISSILSWSAGGSIGLTHFFINAVGMDVSAGYSYGSVASTNVNNVYTTLDSTELLTTASSNYKEKVLTSGVTIGVGFHWFIER